LRHGRRAQHIEGGGETANFGANCRGARGSCILAR
jgi:hypothetical protein